VLHAALVYYLVAYCMDEYAQAWRENFATGCVYVSARLRVESMLACDSFFIVVPETADGPALAGMDRAYVLAQSRLLEVIAARRVRSTLPASEWD
jgi:hypothetical protein